MEQTLWVTKHCASLAGKTVAITGPTGGLGSKICRGILTAGGRLILLGRSAEKMQALKSRLLKDFPQGEITLLSLDLADFSSVKAACQALEALPVDILLHNAGIYDVPRYLCSTGILNIFQVNFAAPYYMTRRLLPLLRSRRGRVTAVGSIAHRYSRTDPEDMDFRSRKHCHLIYGNSKRYLMYGLWALGRQEPLVGFSVGHPGVTVTGISDHYPPWLYRLIKGPMQLIFMKPQKACRGILLALSRDLPTQCWAGPRYFDTWGNPCIRQVHTADSREQQEISDLSRQMADRLEGM